MINEIVALHTGQPYERVAKDTERDRYLTAVQAKEYGIVDLVVGKIAPGSTGLVAKPGEPDRGGEGGDISPAGATTR